MSAEGTPAGGEIRLWLTALEEAVSLGEEALRACDWPSFGTAVAEQRRATHGIGNGLEAARALPPKERDEIDRRIAAVLARRNSQIKRLEEFRNEVGLRLRDLAKYKFALREMETEPVSLALNVTR